MTSPRIISCLYVYNVNEVSVLIVTNLDHGIRFGKTNRYGVREGSHYNYVPHRVRVRVFAWGDLSFLNTGHLGNLRFRDAQYLLLRVEDSNPVFWCPVVQNTLVVTEINIVHHKNFF